MPVLAALGHKEQAGGADATETRRDVASRLLRLFRPGQGPREAGLRGWRLIHPSQEYHYHHRLLSPEAVAQKYESQGTNRVMSLAG